MSREKPKAPSRKPTIPVGTEVHWSGERVLVVAVRARKKFAKRYLVMIGPERFVWFRGDELAVTA